MAERRVGPRDILVARLPLHRPPGHEQEGQRPVVVVAVPRGHVRFPVVVVVPLTTQRGTWAQANPQLYPALAAGSGGVPRASVALVDQIRSLDVSRVAGYLGTLEAAVFAPIHQAVLELVGRPLARS